MAPKLKRYSKRDTVRLGADPSQPPAFYVLDQLFAASTPNAKCVTKITYQLALAS